MQRKNQSILKWIIAVVILYSLAGCAATKGCPNNVSKWERKNTFNK